MKVKTFILILAIFIVSCTGIMTDHIQTVNNLAPSIDGWTAVAFRKPVEGEMVWKGQDLIEKYDPKYTGTFWIMEKIGGRNPLSNQIRLPGQKVVRKASTVMILTSLDVSL
jgi:hypothetical protein